ncbi:MAG: M81 family metallopeptidase [Geminicoccaceae bacterium]
MSRRVLVTGLWHETDAFAATPSELAAFRAYQIFEGEAFAAALGGIARAPVSPPPPLPPP